MGYGLGMGPADAECVADNLDVALLVDVAQGQEATSGTSGFENALDICGISLPDLSSNDPVLRERLVLNLMTEWGLDHTDATCLANKVSYGTLFEVSSKGSSASPEAIENLEAGLEDCGLQYES